MMKRSMVVSGVSLLVLLGLWCVSLLSFPTQTVFAAEKISIGITQIVEHPALDAAREGFVQALADSGFIAGKNVEFEIRSAQGDLSIANMIAEEFARKKKDLILAIATPTAQAVLNATNKIPILITAVTDPVASGLAASLESSGNNLTGTTDLTPIDAQFSLIGNLLPSAHRIGVLYNPAEANSISQVAIARQSANKRNWKLIESTVTNLSEVQIAIEQLAKKVDAIYIPTDNLVASAMPVVIATTSRLKIPVIGSESSQVEAGALATLGIDYRKLGYLTGLMAVKVLQGTSPADLPIQNLQDLTLVINKKTADHLGINLPDAMKKTAVLIQAGE